jgi:thioredoxin-dependent peroxiredoxin
VNAPLSKGEQVPDFTLPTDEGDEVRLRGLKGRWVVLFFYPKALTPGCTTEACGFRDAYAELGELGAEVLGVSHDPVEKLKKFRAKHELTFPLLSDTEHEVTEAYGVYGLKKFMGREYMGIHRATFLIDPKGRIARAWPKVRVKDHVAEVVTALKELKTS